MMSHSSGVSFALLLKQWSKLCVDLPYIME